MTAVQEGPFMRIRSIDTGRLFVFSDSVIRVLRLSDLSLETEIAIPDSHSFAVKPPGDRIYHGSRSSGGDVDVYALNVQTLDSDLIASGIGDLTAYHFRHHETYGGNIVMAADRPDGAVSNRIRKYSLDPWALDAEIEVQQRTGDSGLVEVFALGAKDGVIGALAWHADPDQPIGFGDADGFLGVHLFDEKTMAEQSWFIVDQNVSWGSGGLRMDVRDVRGSWGGAIFAPGNDGQWFSAVPLWQEDGDGGRESIDRRMRFDESPAGAIFAGDKKPREHFVGVDNSIYSGADRINPATLAVEATADSGGSFDDFRFLDHGKFFYNLPASAAVSTISRYEVPALTLSLENSFSGSGGFLVGARGLPERKPVESE